MRNEVNIYQMAAVICLIAMIGIGGKYINLKEAYQQSEKEKNEFCMKYYKLKCG